MAQDPGDEHAKEEDSSSNQPVWPMPEPQPEQPEHPCDRELLLETDGDTLEVSREGVAAKARSIPVTLPLAERQRHKLVHLSHRNWCNFFCVIGRGRQESHKKRVKREIMTPRVWRDYTFLGLAEDLLVVLPLLEEGSGATDAAAVTEKGPAEASQDHHQVPGSVGSGEDGACGRW